MFNPKHMMRTAYMSKNILGARLNLNSLLNRIEELVPVYLKYSSCEIVRDSRPHTSQLSNILKRRLFIERIP